MRMEYRLLENAKKGFIMTREPEVVEEELFITFTGAPTDATAIFENGAGDSLYRLLSNGSCVIPTDFLRSTVSVCVTVLNGSESVPKYLCEGICVQKICGAIAVIPNGLDIPREIIDIFAELQSLREETVRLARKDQELNEKLKKLLDGYDIV